MRKIALARGPYVLGRLSECDIQLDSANVSRRHAELFRDEENVWRIRDLGSRNGTRINGTTIASAVAITELDRIHISGFELRLITDPLREIDPNLRTDGHTTLWATTEPPKDSFTALGSAAATRLHAGQLAVVSGLSRKLMELSDARARMLLLCRTLVESNMQADSCAVIGVNLAAAEHLPKVLCIAQSRDGVEAPGISRAVVEAAVSGEQPILAGGSIASGLTMSFPLDDRGVTAVIACPLKNEGSLAEVLYVTVPHECGTVDWLALVALAAEQFKKAELQIEARKNVVDNAVLQSDLKRARQIQMSLVPKNPKANGIEVAIGFEPCRWIGGDYANVLTAPDGKIFLTVADVSGKGLPAAMVATGVHSIVHATVRAGIGLSELARSLNEFLLESMDRQSFVTMLCVMLDPRDGSAQLVNTGHPPVLIVDATGRGRQLPLAQNPPLGVLPMSVEVDALQLQPGELLILYTDGLNELRDRNGNMIGIDRIREEIAALYACDPIRPLEELEKRFSDRLDEIRGVAAAEDDRTFLLARRL